MTNRFDNKGDGNQNVGQGNGSIGQQNNYGISPEVFAQYAGDLAVTDAALNSFAVFLQIHCPLRGKARGVPCIIRG